MTAIAANVMQDILKKHVSQYAPQDPYYEEIVDAKGRSKRVKRKVPDGLSKRDAKALKKIRKRAHYLDKGMNLCGFRVGWTFFIGIIPGLGDVVDAGLNYCLVLRPARKLDIPPSLVAKMWVNNAISAGFGVIPVVGDIGLAAWKANSRNANLLEAYLTIRAQEFLASLGQGQSELQAAQATHGVSAADLRFIFAPGAGMDAAAPLGMAGPGGTGGSVVPAYGATGSTAATPAPAKAGKR